MLAWICILLSGLWIGFAYAGYPLLLWLYARVAARPLQRAEVYPRLSVILAVHNGAPHLARKLEQTLTLDYPTPVEIWVSSDGSSDETEAIAARFAERGVQLVAQSERRGKEAAQAAAIARASGEILVFSDVTAELESDALREIVQPFADATVGCVSSEDVVESDGGEGAYVRYEMALRRLESQATTLVGLSGSFFALRRELAEPWPAELASDFRSALEAARRGLRSVSEPRARARFEASRDSAQEWRRKVRTVRRGLAVLFAYRELLRPGAGRVAFSLWGHKLARFTSPFALITLLVASAVAAAQSQLALLLLAAQLVFYLAGALALFYTPLTRLLLPRLSAFFLLVNASMLVAWLYHVTGRRAVVWKPTAR